MKEMQHVSFEAGIEYLNIIGLNAWFKGSSHIWIDRSLVDCHGTQFI
jgi:hypothetical protein